MENTYAEHF